MSLSLLDLLVVSTFAMKADFPWWIWVLGALDALSSTMRMDKIMKALGAK